MTGILIFFSTRKNPPMLYPILLCLFSFFFFVLFLFFSFFFVRSSMFYNTLTLPNRLDGETGPSVWRILSLLCWNENIYRLSFSWGKFDFLAMKGCLVVLSHPPFMIIILFVTY